MLYLVDASVLITANNTYYPIDRVPEFWEWIAHQAALGNVKIPQEIYEELLPGRKNDDSLPDWIKQYEEVIVLDEAVDAKLLRRS